MQRKEARKATPIVVPIVTDTSNVTSFTVEADTSDVSSIAILINSTESTTTEYILDFPILFFSTTTVTVGELFPYMISTTTLNVIIDQEPQDEFEFNVVPVVDEYYWDF